MSQYSFRAARAQDIERNWKLFAPDRPLYAPDLWSILPRLWSDLLERQRVEMVVVENADGKAKLVGGSAFVNPRIFNDALQKEAPVCSTLFRLVAQGKVPFLTREQLAAENAKGRLVQFGFTGTPAINLTPGAISEEDAVLLQACIRAYGWHLGGFRVQSLHSEWGSEMGAQLSTAGGFQCIREQPLGDGGFARLMRFTQEDAKRNPGAGASRYLWTPEPRLRLRRPEQQLVSYALQGSSDAEIAELLAITPDGLKKRWRRVYAAVGKAEPHLSLPGGAPQTRRKALLDALRARPEELRPYRYYAPTGSSAGELD